MATKKNEMATYIKICLKSETKKLYLKCKNAYFQDKNLPSSTKLSENDMHVIIYRYFLNGADVDV